MVSVAAAVWLCFCFLLTLIFDIEAVGKRPFKNSAASSVVSKTWYGHLGLPCALAGQQCFDKKTICADVGAGKKDLCQCEENHKEVEGKCQLDVTAEDNVTEASYGGCPYAAELVKKRREELKNAKRKLNNAADASSMAALYAQDK